MLSDEYLRDGDTSAAAAESLDIASKKKKSFNPLRSLKRFFVHGSGSSRHRPDIGSGSGENSVLLKARSTQDVIVVGKEVTQEDNRSGFPRPSKQISLSADSIFPTERTSCDANLQASAAGPASETMLHKERVEAKEMHRRKDDDEGLPQSPLTVNTRSEELFLGNGLKEHSEKWPSFDSGHSLLSVDSNENDIEEDFFKEKWMLASKLSINNTETESSAGESSFQEEFDLNVVQHRPSLSSSAAAHRLAVRPRGKRASSTYQQKLIVASSKSPTSVKALPLVKEESGRMVEKESSSDRPEASQWLDAASEKSSSAAMSAKVVSGKSLELTGGKSDKSLELTGGTSDKSLELTSGMSDKNLELTGGTSGKNLELTSSTSGKSFELTGGKSDKNLELTGGTSGKSLELTGSTSGKSLELTGSTSGKNLELTDDSQKAEKTDTARSSDKDGATDGLPRIKGAEMMPEKSDAVKIARKISVRKPEKAAAVSESTKSDNRGQGAVTPKDEHTERLKMRSSDESLGAKTKNADELSQLAGSVPDQLTDGASTKEMPTEQVPAPAAVVVMRQKLSQGTVPSVQEISEMATKRQTFSFPSESAAPGEEKFLPKRSSLVLTDSDAETGGSELAQMFSRFQRRSSQKKQGQEKESKPVSVTQLANGAQYKVEDVVQSRSNFNAAPQLTGVKDLPPAVKVSPEAKQSEEILESAQKTSDGCGGEAGMSEGQKGKVKTVGISVQPSSSRNMNGKVTDKVVLAGKPKSRYLPVLDQAKTTKPGKDVERKVEQCSVGMENEKTTEKNKDKESKGSEVTEKILTQGFSIRAGGAKVNAHSGSSASDERAKPVKKSCSISYKKAPVSVEKDPSNSNAGSKARAMSQSDTVDDEVAVKTGSVQSVRRGSLTYTHLKPSAVPILEKPKSDNDATAAAVGSSGNIKDASSRSPAAVTTQAASRSGAASSDIPPCPAVVCPAATPIKPAAVSSNPRSVSFRALQGTRPTNASGIASNCLATTAAEASPPKDTFQSTHKPIIRPAGGTKTPPGKITQERENAVEWLGVARRKTEAWTDGKTDVLEKAAGK